MSLEGGKFLLKVIDALCESLKCILQILDLELELSDVGLTLLKLIDSHEVFNLSVEIIDVNSQLVSVDCSKLLLERSY